jgi:hypothetical protein
LNPHLPYNRYTLGVVWVAGICALLPRDVHAQTIDNRVLDCKHVEFSAQESLCDDTKCVLTGNAELRCESFYLRADTLTIRWNSQQEFDGASAQGEVLVLDRQAVMRCEQVELGADRVRGSLRQATVEFKEKPTSDLDKVPSSPTQAVTQGDIQRLSERSWQIKNGLFSLCACKDLSMPWKLTSPTIDIEMGQRATVWWPMVWIDPLGLGAFPITPPLLPLSLPLKERAMGLLIPRFTLQGLAPRVDLPFFLPIGASFDLTFYPGLQLVTLSQDDMNTFRTVSPRMGLRMRYHPKRHWHGELEAHWTWDRRYAGGFQDTSLAHTLDEASDLEQRLWLEFSQRFQPTPAWTWLTHLQWASDDLITTEHRQGLAQQMVQQLPSRTQLNWRSETWPLWGMASADYLLSIQSSASEPGTTQVPTPSILNYKGDELGVWHRGPLLRFGLLPHDIAPTSLPGLSVEAESSLQRLGPWFDGYEPGLWTHQSQLGFAYARRIGPLNAFARADALYAIAFDEANKHAYGGLIQLESGFHMDAVGTLGPFVHRIQPHVKLRTLPVAQELHVTDSLVQPSMATSSLDYALGTEMWIGLEQDFWLLDTFPKSRWRIDLELPIDLASLKLSSPRIEVEWSSPLIGRGRTWLAVDTLGANIASDNTVLASRTDVWLWRIEEVGFNWTSRIADFSWAINYMRLSPGASTFRRNMYSWINQVQVSDILNRRWVHTFQPQIIFDDSQLFIRYAPWFLLPVSGSDGQTFGVAQHQLSVGYTSSCRCWGVRMSASLVGEGGSKEILDSLRMNLNLTVGSYQVGTL